MPQPKKRKHKNLGITLPADLHDRLVRYRDKNFPTEKLVAVCRILINSRLSQEEQEQE